MHSGCWELWVLELEDLNILVFRFVIEGTFEMDGNRGRMALKLIRTIYLSETRDETVMEVGTSLVMLICA